ncbi:MAG: 50S ribosomal protein L24, partial [Candidatus Bathycorpusculaceae bacterium]
MQTAKPVKKPAKQRKMLHQACDHLRRKLLAAPLSPELRKSRGVKALPIRKGDAVRIMRGDHKGFEGKITRIDRKKYRIYVEGLTREKVDGTTIFVPLHPSKVMIKNLNLDDGWRKKILERKKAAPKKVETPLEEPSEEALKEKEKALEEGAAVEAKLPRREKRTKKKRAAKKPTSEKKKAETEEAKT